MATYRSGIDTYNKILQASRTLFYEKGYNETTIRDIAKELDIQPGMVIYHFKSKRDIYLQVFNEAMDIIFNETNQYISIDTKQPFLSFMFQFYLFFYKAFKDEKFLRFQSVGCELIVNDYNFINDEEYFRPLKYYNVFDNTSNNNDYLGYMNSLDITVCKFSDAGVLLNLNNNFDYYKKNSDFKYFAEYSINLYVEHLKLDTEIIKENFETIEKILPTVDWENLNTLLNK